MGTSLAIWWAERSQREQRLLAAMLALLVLVLGWLLVARPLMGALESAKLRHGEAVIAVAEARAQADRDLGRPGRVTAPSVPIEGLISRTATEAGFTGARISAQSPSRARITIESARAPAFLAWVAGLERQGLVVQRLQATPNADRTLTTDTILRVDRR